MTLTAGCSAARPSNSAPPPRPAPPCSTSANRAQLTALLAARSRAVGDPQDYVLASGDLLVVTIYNYRPQGGDFSSDVRVDDQGYISLPMVEPIRVAGLSLSQVRRALVMGLRRAEVLNEPLVSTFLKDYQGQQVVVLGAVSRPGMYSLSRGQQTLVDVISMAGGLAPSAGNYIVVRPNAAAAGQAGSAAPGQDFAVRTAAATGSAADWEAGAMAICLDGPVGSADPAALALPVQGGDLVIVPEAGQAFIDGEVDKPGLYPLARGVTVTQLISTAGGTRYPADRRRVKLIRSTGGGGSTEWEMDLDELTGPEQRDVLLERNDRVVVPYTTGRKIIYGVYQTITTIVRVTVGGAATIF